MTQASSSRDFASMFGIGSVLPAQLRPLRASLPCFTVSVP